VRRWLLRTIALMAAAAVLGYVAHLVVRHTVDPNLPRVKRAATGSPVAARLII